MVHTRSTHRFTQLITITGCHRMCIPNDIGAHPCVLLCRVSRALCINCNRMKHASCTRVPLKPAHSNMCVRYTICNNRPQSTRSQRPVLCHPRGPSNRDKCACLCLHVDAGCSGSKGVVLATAQNTHLARRVAIDMRLIGTARPLCMHNKSQRGAPKLTRTRRRIECAKYSHARIPLGPIIIGFSIKKHMHVNWIMCGVLVRGVEMCGGGVVEQQKKECSKWPPRRALNTR